MTGRLSWDSLLRVSLQSTLHLNTFCSLIKTQATASACASGNVTKPTCLAACADAEHGVMPGREGSSACMWLSGFLMQVTAPLLSANPMRIQERGERLLAGGASVSPSSCRGSVARGPLYSAW